tara:strand:+ start:2881 stop:4479 length:1599 start_codon:yes stop_codon:yes gene_type:complete
MTRYVKTHQPCADCGSSDAVAYYQDGNSYCFSCGIKHSSAGNRTLLDVSIKKEVSMKLDIGTLEAMTDRGISKSTCKFFNVTKGSREWYFPYYDSDHVRVAYKKRGVESKTFSTKGKFSSATLFGQSLFNSGKFITITEGEVDALSTFQMLGSKWPVISIKSGVKSAVKDISDNYEYLNKFDVIKICFDNDDVGRKAAKEVAELLLPKAEIVHLNRKDANEYLIGNDEKEFQRLWWHSEKYTPEGIISGASLWEDVKAGPTESEVSYPYKGLNNLTYGIRCGELITIAAGSGLGKSSFMREIAFHILNKTEKNIGLLFLEESVTRTAQALIGLEMNKPIHLPNFEYTEEELKSAFQNTLEKDRVFFFDHFGSNSIDNIISRVRYMVRVLKCKYIFLDHVSILVSDQSNMDERKALDEIMTKLRTLVQELDICMFVASHLKRVDYGHEEGGRTKLHQLRGSGSIGQLSDIVLGLERDGQAADLRERHTTTVRVIKNRFSGLTGPANNLLYGLDTGRLTEIPLNHDDELDAEAF